MNPDDSLRDQFLLREDLVFLNHGSFGACPRPVHRRYQALQCVLERIWAGVNARTRVLCLDHITSPTALIMPLQSLIRRARQAGILVVIDGAHGPGQVPVDLGDLDPDVYVGNCHKWLLAPKGAGFLWARAEVQPRLQPLVVGWGWRSDRPELTGQAPICPDRACREVAG